MPATEQTWYDQSKLHMVFGFSALAMLIATVWMFAADHAREWKGFQRDFRSAELRLTDWKKTEERSIEQQARAAELEQKLFESKAGAPDKRLVAEFQALALADERRREKLTDEEYAAEFKVVETWLNSSGEARTADGMFASLDRDYNELEDLAANAAARRDEVVASNSIVTKIREQLGALGQQLNSIPADAPEGQKEAIEDQIAAGKKELKSAEKSASSVSDTANDEMAKAVKKRESVVSQLEGILADARFREGQMLSRRKFKSADVDKAKGDYDLGIRDNLSAEELAGRQAIVDELVGNPDDGLSALTLKRQDSTAHRDAQQRILKQITQPENDVMAEIEANNSAIALLDNKEKERRSTFFTSVPPFFLGKRWLELPILDAFGSPLKIDNLWTEGLELTNGSFGKVRRFDRCTTCHQGIDKTEAGSAVKPAYQPSQLLEFTLLAPDAPPAAKVDDDGDLLPLELRDVYGFGLAGFGLVDDDDVTINTVVAESLASSAKATFDAHGEASTAIGLRVGDVIQYVNGDKVLSPRDAAVALVDGVEWGESVTLTVRRGLPQPFTSHPRLDLFVGSLSPHSKARMACTVCHEGQGSATTFKWASHAPNSIEQEEEWADEHGWFHNHHWILPMYPKRLAEAACLKCHHDVASLEPSRKFPDPPAPKVVEGWKLIGEYGCYGCHEMNGYDGPDKRIGPDLRLEPNYFAAAGQVKSDPGFAQVDAGVQAAADSLVQQPFRDDLRRTLREFLQADKVAETPKLTAYSHKMADVLANQDAPGTRRKSGPSLRFVASKVGRPFLYDWIRKPKDFRPSTKMPQFFEQWNHLDGHDLDVAKKFERVEILGMVEYLLDRSQSFEYLPAAEGVEAASAERGKLAFELRGCIACHQHEDFPHVTSHQGPNLTGLGDKFAEGAGGPNGQAWLYSWIKRPTHYHARTKMPDLYLDPIENEDGTVTDPVADMVAYLMSSRKGWQPSAETMTGLRLNSEHLNELAFEHLEGAFPRRRAQEYLQDGIPSEIARTLKGVEVELEGAPDDRKKLLYVGRKAISKYGCYGCHDIPGFEDSKPIGAALAEWGRKESSKLAFEHIAEYLHHGHGGGHGESHGEHGDSHAGGHGDEHAGGHDGDHAMAHDGHGGHGGHGEEFDDSYYMGQIAVADRSGFIWQKLKEPRSYDYKKVNNKKYNDRLRMPLFPFNGEEREAVVTFVLGLVADPPADEFVYNPDPKGAAIAEGRRVLEKFNCGGCHILDGESWDLEFTPGDLGEAPELADYPFLDPHFTPDQLANSQKTDKRRGVISTVIRGLPAIGNDSAQFLVLDEDEDEVDPEEEYDPDTLLYPFDLWEPIALEGVPFQVGAQRINVPASSIRKRSSSRGGDLTYWLLPRVLEEEKKVNPAANGTEAWSWLPPPLMGEGRKVQPDWLHSFLLEPYPIRPAVFLRMPKFNMSPAEASALVDYFAAKDGAAYPFEYSDRMMASHIGDQNEAFAAAHGADRLSSAMSIVTHKDYCVQCHYVGDYAPTNNVRALAPDLSKVQFRLRPDYIKKWIANPKTILPYTAMPVNVLYDPASETLGGVPQNLYPGTSVEQVDALVDLLMNYSQYSGSQHSVKGLVGGGAAPAQPAANPAAAPAAAPAQQPDANGAASREAIPADQEKQNPARPPVQAAQQPEENTVSARE